MSKFIYILMSAVLLFCITDFATNKQIGSKTVEIRLIKKNFSDFEEKRVVRIAYRVFYSHDAGPAFWRVQDEKSLSGASPHTVFKGAAGFFFEYFRGLF